MNCFFCPREAELICACSTAYYCSFCIGGHLTQPGSHIVTNFEINIDPCKSRELEQVILLRLNLIEHAQNQIVLETKKTISSLESLSKNLLTNLKNIAQRYLWFLNKQSFTRTEWSEIEEILDTVMQIEPIRIEMCSCIKEQYTKDLIVFKKHEINIIETPCEVIPNLRISKEIVTWTCECGRVNIEHMRFANNVGNYSLAWKGGYVIHANLKMILVKINGKYVKMRI